jgi:hypothetical protein
LILGSAIILALSLEVLASETSGIAEMLPPPPPIGIDAKTVKTKVPSLPVTNLEPPTYIKSNASREYTFSAPHEDAQPNINVELDEAEALGNRAQTYRVEVFGNTEGLLEIVKSIEPKAFQKGNIIQVGIFSSQDNATVLVNKLATRGFWSRIVVNN